MITATAISHHMWHSLLDKGKELAEQAKRAAAELEGRLDESAGVVVSGTDSSSPVTLGGVGALDDHWDDDDDDDNDEQSMPKQHQQSQENEEQADEEGEFTTTTISAAGGGDAVKTDWAGSSKISAGEEEAKPCTSENDGGWAEEGELDIDGDEDEHEVPLEHMPAAEAKDRADDDDNLGKHHAEQTSIQEQQQAAHPLHDSMEELGDNSGDETPDGPRIKESEEVDDTPATKQLNDKCDVRPEPHNESAPPPPQHHAGVGFFGALAHTPTSKGILGGLSQLAQQITTGDDDNEYQEDITEENSQDLESPLEDLTISIAELSPKLAARHTITEEEDENANEEAINTIVPASIPVSEHESAAGEVSTAHGSASDEVARFLQQQVEYTQMMEAKMEELQLRLSQREDQLLSKTEQLTQMETLHESEKQELVQKIQNTKDEAKRRIQKAKEHVEAIELRLNTVTSSQGSSAEEFEKQAEIIAALREEGVKLARKQADMEAAVRAAKGEARELRELLEGTEAERQTALEKIEKLQAELKVTKEDLTSARKGESQAGKLDSDLRQLREESEKRAATILSLEQEIKELRASEKELTVELESTRQGAAVETEQERKKLRKEHIQQVADLEAKLQKSEREAAVREDALRHEVDELRKRWQDAVRRADALSVDVQSSTAPLLRQLESTNKQNRARAAAWAELETQLRAELEEIVISSEQLAKERSEWKTKCTRFERSTKEYETEMKQLKGELHDKSERMRQLEHELEELKTVGEKMKNEWAEVERLANEGVSRVRSEMTRTVVDAEERHRAQVESLGAQLAQEREQRDQLEKKLAKLLEQAGMFVPQEPSSLPLATVVEARPKRLRNSEGQAEILAGALDAFGSDGENSDDEDENEVSNNGTGSFAALEQLTSRLKASKIELTTLRKRLEESEWTREELVQVLAESRNAREKLPLFEAKVQELTVENEELKLEVQGLREDIVETREMYRTQLNVLLEAQAESPHTNGDSKNNTEYVEPNEQQSEVVVTMEASPSTEPKSADI